MKTDYVILDVCAGEPFCGITLAFIPDCDVCADVDDTRRLALARSFNLPATVFLVTPRNPVHSARVHMFSPHGPVLPSGLALMGAAVALAQHRAPNLIARNSLSIVLESAAGTSACTLHKKDDGTIHAHAPMPLLPTIGTIVSQSGALAEALGLTPDDLGFDQHQPIIVHLGPCSFLLVPVAGQAALMRARAGDGLRAFVSEAGSGAGMGLLLYSSQVRVADHALHLREWVFRDGIFREDLAHGAAVAALAGALVHFDHPCDGTHDMLLACGGHAEAQVQNQVQNQDQAPALVRLELEVTAGALTHVALAGTVRLSRQGQMIF